MSDNQLECIVKLGGRAVTFKEQFETANIDAINTAARMFAQGAEFDTGVGDHGCKFIVVHGAG